MDKGYTRAVLAHLGNMQTGTVVTIDEVRANLDIVEASDRTTIPSIMSTLCKGDDPILRRERVGVYRVIRGRSRVGRPPGKRTQLTHPSTPLPPQAPPGAMPQDAPDTGELMLLQTIRTLPDGSVLASDENGGIYKIVQVA